MTSIETAALACGTCGIPQTLNGSVDPDPTRLDAYENQLAETAALRHEHAELTHRVDWVIPGALAGQQRLGDHLRVKHTQAESERAKARLAEIEARLDELHIDPPSNGVCECGTASFVNGRLDRDWFQTGALDRRLAGIEDRLAALENRKR